MKSPLTELAIRRWNTPAPECKKPPQGRLSVTGVRQPSGAAHRPSDALVRLVRTAAAHVETVTGDDAPLRPHRLKLSDAGFLRGEDAERRHADAGLAADAEKNDVDQGGHGASGPDVYAEGCDNRQHRPQAEKRANIALEAGNTGFEFGEALVHDSAFSRRSYPLKILGHNAERGKL